MPTEERQNRPKAGVYLHLKNMNENKHRGAQKWTATAYYYTHVYMFYTTILFSTILLRYLYRYYNRLDI